VSLAVVSGGGTGIGAATARALAEAGYDVIIIGRRAEVVERAAAQLSNATDRVITPIVADLAQPADVERAAAAIGPVDVLVNAAGGYRGGDSGSLDRAESERAPQERARRRAILEAVAAHWQANFEANVLTAVLLTEALKGRLTRPGGSVILISSIAAQRGGGGPYSAAKAALHGWLHDLARELSPAGVTVNVLAPGYVADTEFFGDRMTPAGHADRVAQTLVGRAGEPADIADAVRYLVSARYVTAQIIGINGGSVLGR
jgi:3-oxoacyl-[acyl-carrier protein] reductase